MRIETKVWASAAPPPAQHRASGLKSPALSLGRETDEASNNPTFLEEALCIQVCLYEYVCGVCVCW